jgi:hypothetical protein
VPSNLVLAGTYSDAFQGIHTLSGPLARFVEGIGIDSHQKDVIEGIEFRLKGQDDYHVWDRNRDGRPEMIQRRIAQHSYQNRQVNGAETLVDLHDLDKNGVIGSGERMNVTLNYEEGSCDSSKIIFTACSRQSTDGLFRKAR